MSSFKPYLSVGMAVYDDFNGAYFTQQAMRMSNDCSEVEFIIVDNNPKGDDAAHLRKLSAMCGPDRGKYIPMESGGGTSQPRNRVFAEARGEVVMCVDCHILLHPGALNRLIEWFKKNPDSKDLVSGPLIYDDLRNITTQYNPIWRKQMWGVWSIAYSCQCGKLRFTCVEDTDNGPVEKRRNPKYKPDGDPTEPEFVEHRTSLCRYWEQNMPDLYNPATIKPGTSCPECGDRLPPISLRWHGHEEVLQGEGFRILGRDDTDEAFEIPGQGLGLFVCRKSAWLGFNKEFRGFGGEELYIHHKFRAAGHKCLSLPFLKWNHRFHRPGGVPYELTARDKARNNVIGHNENGMPLDQMHAHWVVDESYLSQQEWDELVKDPLVWNTKPGNPAGPAPSKTEGFNTVEELFEKVHHPPRPKDLEQHMPKLRELAAKCEHVTEFSERIESAVAFMAGKPKRFMSHNTASNDLVFRKLQNAATLMETPTSFIYDNTDSLGVEIEPTDLLFIDTKHNGNRLTRELAKHAHKVSRFIVVHDTDIYGNQGDDGGPGLQDALRRFCRETDPRWFVVYHTSLQYGLTVIGCREEDKPEKEIIIWHPGYGPGVEMKKLLSAMGINSDKHCSCNTRADQMDMWGVQGCKDHRDEIIGWIYESKAQWGWDGQLKSEKEIAKSDETEEVAETKGVMWKAWKGLQLFTGGVRNGVALKMLTSGFDPVVALVDLAIANAEAEEEKRKAGAR